MSAGLILLFLLVLFVVVIFIKLQNAGMVYVASDVDHEQYLVRDLSDKQNAANMLAKIKNNIETLTNYLYSNKNSYPDYVAYIDQLHSRIKNVVVLESSEDSVYTSYSVNKGDQIVFCLRSRDIPNQMHRMNLLMYVVLHEMSHVACPEYGHTELFKKIFAFITERAISIGLYTKIDFAKEPTEYCGLTITDSII
jgi:predicted RND superfamily exporter protein